MLSEFAKENSDDVVVVFFSLDQSETAMYEYARGKGWLCLPFRDQRLHQALLKDFSFHSIPTLGVSHPSGPPVTDWGRSAVSWNSHGCVEAWKTGDAGIHWYNFLKLW